MGDFAHASINIGGPLNQKQARAAILGLAKQMGHDGIEDAITLFANAIENLSTVAYDEEEASGGLLPWLETTLKKHRIPFTRSSGATTQCDAELYVFTGDQERLYTVSVDDSVSVDLADLRRAQKEDRVEDFIDEFALSDWIPPPIAASPRERIPILAAIVAIRTEITADKTNELQTRSSQNG